MIQDDIKDINPEAIVYDGFDDAIIGISERSGMNKVVAYDRDKVIGIIVAQQTTTEADLTEDDIRNGVGLEDRKYQDALEHFEYNVLGGYVGENTPVFITKM